MRKSHKCIFGDLTHFWRKKSYNKNIKALKDV